MTDRPAEGTTAPPGPEGEGTAARAPIGGRISARLNKAAEEHRASATRPVPPSSDSRASSGSRVSGGSRALSASAPSGGNRGPRRARLRLTRVDPWSVMKTAFLLSIAFGIVTVVSVLMVWSVLGAAGVWDSINQTVSDVVGGDASTSFDIENYVGTSRVLGFTMLVAAIDVVLLTAIATLAAFLYNMAAALLGGIEVTLAEDN